MKKVSLSGHHNSPLYLWQIGTDQNPISGGLNLTDLEYMLSDNQSPKMENMWYHNRVLGKRPGQRYEGPVLPDVVHTLYRFGSAIYGANDSSVFCLKQDAEGQLALSQMAANLTGKGFAHFYEFGGKLFLMNGANHLVLENQAFVPVIPYTPTLVINRSPNGLGGDLVENYNRLGGAFCNKFSADGTSTVYVLTDQNLDDSPIAVTVNGVAMTTGFSVDRVKGTVTFSAAPAKGTNNVEISAYKEDAAKRTELLSCTCSTAFGGENGTRLFFSGNGTANYYYSDVARENYFPDNNYNTVGAGDPITALALQYGVLILFTSSEIWQLGYEFDGNRAIFPLKAVNRSIGCDAPKSVCLVDNHLVFLNSKRGIFMLLSTAISDERNVQKISRNIEGNGGLFDLQNLTEAVAGDFYGKYWLCIGDRCFLWDYEISPYQSAVDSEFAAKHLSWFMFNNIACKSFINTSGLIPLSLGFGYLRGNRLSVFDEQYRDYGLGYRGLWRMPVRAFHHTNQKKTIQDLFITTRTDTNTKISVNIITDQTRQGELLSPPIKASSFSWSAFAFDTFTYSVFSFAKTFKRKIKQRNCNYFALEFFSNEAGRDMNISGIALSWKTTSSIKS